MENEPHIFESTSEPTFEPINTWEYKPVPPKSEWANMSVNQLIDIKNRLMGYSNNMPSNAPGQLTLQQGIATLDRMILAGGR